MRRPAHGWASVRFYRVSVSEVLDDDPPRTLHVTRLADLNFVSDVDPNVRVAYLATRNPLLEVALTIFAPRSRNTEPYSRNVDRLLFGGRGGGFAAGRPEF